MDRELIEKLAQKVSIYGDLDEVIEKLKIFKNADVNVYVDFNGSKLYSLLDDADSCYKKVTGKTKAEFEEAERQWREEYERKEAAETEKAKAAIPSYIEAGKELIYPQKFESWKSCVKNRVSDLYHGADLVNALEAMKELENSGDFAKAKSIIDSAGHSGASYGMVMKIIVNFSKKGPDFYEFMEPEYSGDKKTQEFLNKLREENAKYEAESAPTGTGLGE